MVTLNDFDHRLSELKQKHRKNKQLIPKMFRSNDHTKSLLRLKNCQIGHTTDFRSQILKSEQFEQLNLN